MSNYCQALCHLPLWWPGATEQYVCDEHEGGSSSGEQQGPPRHQHSASKPAVLHFIATATTTLVRTPKRKRHWKCVKKSVSQWCVTLLSKWKVIVSYTLSVSDNDKRSDVLRGVSTYKIHTAVRDPPWDFGTVLQKWPQTTFLQGQAFASWWVPSHTKPLVDCRGATLACSLLSGGFMRTPWSACRARVFLERKKLHKGNYATMCTRCH